MGFALVRCDLCGVSFTKENSALLLARIRFDNIYCTKKCSCEARRCGRTEEEQKQRNKNLTALWKVKNNWKSKARTPEQSKKDRELRVKYYKKYKEKNRERFNQYCRERRSKISYGEFWECQLLKVDIKKIIKIKIKQSRI